MISKKIRKTNIWKMFLNIVIYINILFFINIFIFTG